MNPALIRLVLLLIVLVIGSYGFAKLLLWTPFFKNKKRLEKILKVALTLIIAVTISIFTIAFLYSLEHVI